MFASCRIVSCVGSRIVSCMMMMTLFAYCSGCEGGNCFVDVAITYEWFNLIIGRWRDEPVAGQGST